MASLLFMALVSGSAEPSDPGKPCAQPELRQELLAMMKADQDARVRLLRDDQQAAEFVRALDRRHTARMHEIVAKFGWPGRSLVGRDGAKAAWLLVQHADHDRAFQKECLGRMHKSPAGEVEPHDLAYLTDRVLLAEGKPQRYGTQLEAKNGKLEPRLLEEPDRVDERRQSIGLAPLAEYVKFAEQALEELREQGMRSPAGSKHGPTGSLDG